MLWGNSEPDSKVHPGLRGLGRLAGLGFPVPKSLPAPQADGRRGPGGQKGRQEFEGSGPASPKDQSPTATLIV